MQVYKFTQTEGHSDMSEEVAEEFFSHSHGMGTHEWTLCSIAPEEWNYTNKTPVKKITCPLCLREIAHCKSYKGK